jgi:hypothetical protein
MIRRLIENLRGSLYYVVSFDMLIDAVDGSGTVIKSQLFSAYIMPSFANTHSDTASTPTPKTSVLGAQLMAHATFKEMFEPLANNLNDIALTEHQIVNFIQNNRDWMNEGDTTYFLFKYRGHICIAAVFPTSGKTSFGLDVYTLDNETKWNHPRFCNRIVVPWCRY